MIRITFADDPLVEWNYFQSIPTFYNIFSLNCVLEGETTVIVQVAEVEGAGRGIANGLIVLARALLARVGTLRIELRVIAY
jgi:hypothetical protein